MNHLQASHLFDLADGLSAVIDSMHARDEDREHQAGLLAAAGHQAVEHRLAVVGEDEVFEVAQLQGRQGGDGEQADGDERQAHDGLP